MEQGSIAQASPAPMRTQLWRSVEPCPRCRHRPVCDGRTMYDVRYCDIERQEWREAMGTQRTERGTGYFFSSVLCLKR